MLIMQMDYSLILAKGIFCKANNQIGKLTNIWYNNKKLDWLSFFVLGPIKRAQNLEHLTK